MNVKDDLLFSGTIDDRNALTEAIRGRFEIVKAMVDGTIRLNSCFIRQDEEVNIEMGMYQYIYTIPFLGATR